MVSNKGLLLPTGIARIARGLAAVNQVVDFISEAPLEHDVGELRWAMLKTIAFLPASILWILVANASGYEASEEVARVLVTVWVSVGTPPDQVLAVLYGVEGSKQKPLDGKVFLDRLVSSLQKDSSVEGACVLAPGVSNCGRP